MNYCCVVNHDSSWRNTSSAMAKEVSNKRVTVSGRAVEMNGAHDERVFIDAKNARHRPPVMAARQLQQ